ncbi:hypothetical protein MHK_001839 [Candidatus Magnetomorum sp. HK-1]|nr:hypothetical protein MHK_001839 [Candidatus Magnetomorum sp. HK-1]
MCFIKQNIKSSPKAPNPFKLELLEPRLLLSADPISETVQTLVSDIPESVINVDPNNSKERLENQDIIEKISSAPQEDTPQESDIIEETDFYDLKIPDGKLSLDILSQNTLDFSDINEDLALLIDSSNTLSITNILNNESLSLLDEADLQFSLEDIDTIIGGKGENTFLFEEEAFFDGIIDSSLGTNDTLALSGDDRIWHITDFDEGIVDNIHFKGIENLKGGEDNKDTFVFESTGHISGIIDGGDAGFDTLSLLGNHDTITYSANSPDSGTVNRDNDIITYMGLEPIYDNTNTAKTCHIMNLAILAGIGFGLQFHQNDILKIL